MLYTVSFDKIIIKGPTTSSFITYSVSISQPKNRAKLKKIRFQFERIKKNFGLKIQRFFLMIFQLYITLLQFYNFTRSQEKGHCQINISNHCGCIVSRRGSKISPPVLTPPLYTTHFFANPQFYITVHFQPMIQFSKLHFDFECMSFYFHLFSTDTMLVPLKTHTPINVNMLSDM